MMEEPAKNDIPREALQATTIVQALLGDRVVGLYLFGSAVQGGLRVDSDVDVLVLVKQPLLPEARRELVSRLMEISGRIGNTRSARPLELTIVDLADVEPWRYPPRAEFVFGEWLREQFEDGAIPGPTVDPDLTIVLKTLMDHSIPLCGPEASSLLPPIPMADIRRAIKDSLPGLLESLHGDERNVILTLARMWLTAAQGTIAPKDVAAAWAMEQLPAEWASLLNEARQGYLGEVQDNWSGRAAPLKRLVDQMTWSIRDCLGA